MNTENTLKLHCERTGFNLNQCTVNRILKGKIVAEYLCYYIIGICLDTEAFLFIFQ